MRLSLNSWRERKPRDETFNYMFISQLYLNVKPVVIIIRTILHKNVFKFQVPVHYICKGKLKIRKKEPLFIKCQPYLVIVPL